MNVCLREECRSHIVHNSSVTFNIIPDDEYVIEVVQAYPRKVLARKICSDLTSAIDFPQIQAGTVTHLNIISQATKREWLLALSEGYALNGSESFTANVTIAYAPAAPLVPSRKWRKKSRP